MISRKKVFWWSPPNYLLLPIFKKENVGDFFGPVLVDRILKSKGFEIKKINCGNNKLISVGSAMHFANNNDVIWGTGVNGKISYDQLKFVQLDVRATRGPLTADVLKSKNIIFDKELFGDPGILASKFWPRNKSIVPNKIVYVPHFEESLANLSPDLRNKLTILSPLTKLDKFLEEIQTAEKVVSSSLHGLIFAESYGIPAALLKNVSGETTFKYEDYYKGTFRDSFKVYESIESALSADIQSVDLSKAQERILSAFPWDLWNK